jgi:hypothetical protein
MARRYRNPKSSSPGTGEKVVGRVLPSLATAEQIAEVLQVSARTVHLWAAAETIPTALRQGKIVRFHPPAVAAALGINLPEFGTSIGGGCSPEMANTAEAAEIHKTRLNSTRDAPAAVEGC